MGDPVECRAKAFHVVVDVGGPDLDLIGVDVLRARFNEVAAGDPAAIVVVDLSGVTFMDCAGLGPLVGARARFGSRLVLRGVGPKVARLFDLAGLDGLFDLVEDGMAPACGNSSPAEGRSVGGGSAGEVEALVRSPHGGCVRG